MDISMVDRFTNNERSCPNLPRTLIASEKHILTVSRRGRTSRVIFIFYVTTRHPTNIYYLKTHRPAIWHEPSPNVTLRMSRTVYIDTIIPIRFPWGGSI